MSTPIIGDPRYANGAPVAQRSRMAAQYGPLLRDALAVALLIVGMVGLAWAAFSMSREAGIGVVSIYLIAAGAALGYDRSTDSR